MTKSKKLVAFVIFPLLFLLLIIFTLVIGGLEISSGSRTGHPVNPIGSLTVNIEFGTIHIETTDEDRIDIATTKKWEPKFGIFQGLKHSKRMDELLKDFAVKTELDEPDVQSHIRVEGKFKRGREYWQEDLKQKWLTIEVRVTVPRRYDVILKTESGGDIFVGNLVGTVRAEALDGNLHLGEIRGDVWGKTGMNGAITLKSGQRSVDLTAAMGDIHVEMIKQPEHAWTLYTSESGKIDVRLHSDIALNIDAQTQGKISNDLPIRSKDDIGENTLTGTLNHGGPLLRLRSSTGEIHLKRK